MLTFALLRDSSDLHIYKDSYGKNNDCLCNLWNVAIKKKSSYLVLAECFFPSCVVFEPIYGLSVGFRETGLLSQYIIPKVGYSDEAVNPIHWRKTAVNSLQQVQSPRHQIFTEAK